MKKFLSVILAITLMAIMAIPAFATDKTNSEALSNPIQKKIAIAIVDGYDDPLCTGTPEDVVIYATKRLTPSDLDANTLIADIDVAVKTACSDLKGSWNSPAITTKRDALKKGLTESLVKMMGITTTATPPTTATTAAPDTTAKPPFTLPTLPPPMTDENGSTIKQTLPTLPPMTDKDGNTIAPPDADAINGKVQEVIGGIVDFFSGLFGGAGGGGAADPTDPTEPTEEDTTTDDGSGSDEIVDDVPQTGDIALYSVASVALVAGIALVLTKKKKD